MKELAIRTLRYPHLGEFDYAEASTPVPVIIDEQGKRLYKVGSRRAKAVGSRPDSRFGFSVIVEDEKGRRHPMNPHLLEVEAGDKQTFLKDFRMMAQAVRNGRRNGHNNNNRRQEVGRKLPMW